ncbi:MAG: type II secretion system protein, partial [Burkholderiales bacterium]
MPIETMHRPSIRRQVCTNQHGYSLIELTIVLVILTGAILGLFAIYQFKQATDKADIIAGQYLPKTARLTVTTGNYQTPYSCSD